MKQVVAFIQNKLLSSGLKHAVLFSEPKSSVAIVGEVQSSIVACRGSSPDVFIAEVRDTSPLTTKEWFVRITQIKESEKNCKIIFIVDEENWPISAKEVKEAFKEKKIDLFFYSTSGLDYIADAINNL